MSDTSDNGYDDANDSGGSGGDNGPGDLRAALRKANARAADLEKELSGLRETARTNTVAESLRGAGADARLAKYIPKEVTDAEGVNKWLAEEGDLFGYKPQSSNDDSGNQDGQSTDTEGNAPADGMADFLAQLSRAQETERRGETAITPQKAEQALAALDKAGSFDNAVAALRSGSPTA